MNLSGGDCPLGDCQAFTGEFDKKKQSSCTHEISSATLLRDVGATTVTSAGGGGVRSSRSFHFSVREKTFSLDFCYSQLC